MSLLTDIMQPSQQQETNEGNANENSLVDDAMQLFDSSNEHSILSCSRSFMIIMFIMCFLSIRVFLFLQACSDNIFERTGTYSSKWENSIVISLFCSATFYTLGIFSCGFYLYLFRKYEDPNFYITLWHYFIGVFVLSSVSYKATINYIRLRSRIIQKLTDANAVNSDNDEHEDTRNNVIEGIAPLNTSEYPNVKEDKKNV